MHLTEQERQRLLQVLGHGRGVPMEVRVVRDLGRDDLVDVLRIGETPLVIENHVSDQPVLIPPSERFDVWKTEVKPRLVEPDTTAFRLTDYPDGYCFRALLCETSAAGSVVVLRMHH